jgi:outer membrane lipoprotein-sorting protein
MAAVAALVCVLAVWMAAPALVGDGGPDREAVGTDATERFLALDGLAGTVARVGDGSAGPRIVRRVWIRPGTGSLRATTLAGPEAKRGTIVSNGSTTWVYSRARNRATRYVEPTVVGPDDRAGDAAGSDTTPADRDPLAARQSDRVDRIERLEQLFERLNVSARAADRAAGTNVTLRVTTLPVVPRPDGGELPAVRSGRFRLTFAGTDRIADRQTYVLRIASVGDLPGRIDSYTRTLSVDAEHFAVLRDHVETVVDGRQTERTRVYRNVTFDPGIEDDRFRFDPPADATVTTRDPAAGRIDTYVSRRALADGTAAPVPDLEPALPRTFAFERGVYRSGTGSIRVEYGNATARVAVDVNRAGGLTRADDPDRTVRIDGREVAVQWVGPLRAYSWRCGGYQYHLTAEGVSVATARAAVAAVSCSA